MRQYARAACVTRFEVSFDASADLGLHVRGPTRAEGAAGASAAAPSLHVRDAIGAAATFGVRRGDRIIALGDVPVALGTSVEAFAAAVADERARRSANGLCLTFERDTCQMI